MARGWKWMLDGGTKLKVSAQRWHEAENECPMAVQSWKLAHDAGARLKMSAWWRRKAWEGLVVSMQPKKMSIVGYGMAGMSPNIELEHHLRSEDLKENCLSRNCGLSLI